MKATSLFHNSRRGARDAGVGVLLCAGRPAYDDHDDRPTYNRTTASARTFKAATTSKENKTKSNHVQPKATQIKTDGNPHNQNK
jgi:hypothetical protein